MHLKSGLGSLIFRRANVAMDDSPRLQLQYKPKSTGSGVVDIDWGRGYRVGTLDIQLQAQDDGIGRGNIK